VEELIGWLLELGTDVELIGPDDVRAQLVTHLREMMDPA
jgi:hypothetical protein